MFIDFKTILMNTLHIIPNPRKLGQIYMYSMLSGKIYKYIRNINIYKRKRMLIRHIMVRKKYKNNITLRKIIAIIRKPFLGEWVAGAKGIVRSGKVRPWQGENYFC